MRKMKRESCPVCSRAVALNWRSREMAHHLERFPRSQKTLVAALSGFDLDSLGSGKYEREGQEIMHHVLSLIRLLLRSERERRRTRS
jgi:hypothetical protein